MLGQGPRCYAMLAGPVRSRIFQSIFSVKQSASNCCYVSNRREGSSAGARSYVTETTTGPKTLILTQKEVASLLTSDLAIPVVERGFAALGRGEVYVPKKLFVDIPAVFGGEFQGMPAFFEDSVGFKWVNLHAANKIKFGLPMLMGVFVLSDPTTAIPLAIMDGTLITAVRTGAAGAVASKHLARKVPRSLGIIGSGAQSRMQIAAHRQLYAPRGIQLNVVVHDKDTHHASKLVAEVGGKVGSMEEAASCDIICTCTPAREVLLDRKWVRPGTHINAIGADSAGKQELDPALLRLAKIYVDDMEQAVTHGEVNVPIRKGILTEDDIFGTLGDVVVKKKPGRQNDEDITIFDSTGLAIHDVGIARAVYNRARNMKVGTDIYLFDTNDVFWPRDS